jgi:hypothetical protein
MIFGASKILAGILSLGLITCQLARGVCPVNVVVVKGQVKHAPPNAKVRVELVYPKKQGADSAEMTLGSERFSIPVEFLTQSRRPLLVGSLGEKCDRKPETVVVTLVGSDPSQEYDRVSLDLKKDFKLADPSAYTLRSEIVLNGPQ